jgi:hypothetical protein
MPKQSSKRQPSSDPNLTAFAAVQHVIEQTESEPKAKTAPTKNPAAVALGRLGGLKGGKARAEKLSARKRSAIAKKGAAARWKTKQG